MRRVPLKESNLPNQARLAFGRSPTPASGLRRPARLPRLDYLQCCKFAEGDSRSRPHHDTTQHDAVRDTIPSWVACRIHVCLMHRSVRCLFMQW